MLTVVVDYRGLPELKDLWTRLNVPYFNRVTQIHHRVREAASLPIDRRTVSRFRSLETLTVTALGRQSTPLSERELTQLAPPCRLADMTTRDDQITLHLETGFVRCDASSGAVVSPPSN